MGGRPRSARHPPPDEHGCDDRCLTSPPGLVTMLRSPGEPMTPSPAQTAEIAAALARIPRFAGRPLDGLRVEPLASLTNRNYKVSLGGEDYVLRIAGAGTERYIDRAAEARNAGLAASLGIAPELLHLDPASGLMLTRFIEGGTSLQAADLRRPERLRAAV